LRIFLAFAAAAAIAVAPAHGQTSTPLGTSTQGGSGNYKSDWELQQERLDWKEGEIKLPVYPKAEDLIEFFVSGASSFRFFIDSASLSPAGRDDVVRYTLVARSSSGVANVSYEGMRCTTHSYKLYALGNEGRWTVRESEWRPIEPRSVQRWHNELSARYFCPGNAPIYTAAEGVELLRRGGHTVGSEYGRGR
jgi:hypothetical protein